MKRRDLVRHIERHGCVLVREGARHSWYRNPANGSYAAVPRHREIVEFLSRKICRALGLPAP
ncbi:MAG: type II toxin-antitoxin system HicA family toxin [Planctomycetes bacterium]|nr:type II toxin-antitoxin system HicA family toxin [Planctomycetota bacterium]